MGTNPAQVLLFCGGVFALSFFAIWAFWFAEKWREDSALKVAALPEKMIVRR